ncbi:MAG: putative PEP-binding protein, partial [bacterium]
PETAATTPPMELERFRKAVTACREQLFSLEKEVAADSGDNLAMIFEAQRLFLEDPSFLDEVEKHITPGGEKTETALHFALQKIRENFSSVKDEYISGRFDDLLDVAKRLVRQLSGRTTAPLENMEKPAIIFSFEFLPSQIAQMDGKMVLGLVSEKGSHNSHAAILARARGIPAVFGVAGALSAGRGAENAIVDGGNGFAILNPDEKTSSRYHRLIEEKRTPPLSIRTIPPGDPLMKDGKKITLLANAASIEEARRALEEGAEGIGLLRSEQFFLMSRNMPEEEAQTEFYRSILALFAPRPVTIRTLDIGGDKIPAYISLPKEENPALGLRGIRFSLARRDIFKSQLKAIIMASAAGKARIMLPMVSAIEEVIAAAAIIEEAASECRREQPGQPRLGGGSRHRLRRDHAKGEDRMREIYSAPPLGIMIETPAAALTAERLAPAVDFFSIGSNDLAQYTLAADRGSLLTGSGKDYYHPAVLKLIKITVEAAGKFNREVSLCGEMASDPAAAVLLAGLGLKVLSVNPAGLPAVRKALASFDSAEALKLAERALSSTGSEEVERLLKDDPRLARE